MTYPAIKEGNVQPDSNLTRSSTRKLQTNGLLTWRIRRVSEYVDSHFAHAITLIDLANAAGLSRMHFAAKFRQFIKEAAPLFAKSLSSSLESLDELVALYALVSRLRLVASVPVLRAAESLVETIGRQYSEPNLTLTEIEAAGHSGKVDPLGAFSAAYRQEIRNVMWWNSKFVRWKSEP